MLTPELLAQALEAAAKVLRGEILLTAEQAKLPTAPVEVLDVLAAFVAKGVDPHTKRILADLERFARERQKAAARPAGCTKCNNTGFVDIPGTGGPETKNLPYLEPCPQCRPAVPR